MTHYVIELIVWMLLAFFIGCLIGWLLRSLFGQTEEPAATRQPAEPLAQTAPASEPAAAPPPPAAPKPIEPEIIAPLPVSAVPGAVRMERPKGLEAARGGKPDNLQMISGVGPRNELVLHNLGFFHFDQIASWTPQQVAWVDDHLKFGGRIEREQWIAQAKLLAAGDFEGFRARFGTGGLSAEDFAAATEQGTAAATPAAALASSSPSATSLRERPQGIDKPRGGKADNLQRISGVGPKNEKILHNLGVFHFDQIAAWSVREIAWVDEHLKFNGRIEREEWVVQCKLLAAGKDEEFAKRWGTGGLKPPKK